MYHCCSGPLFFHSDPSAHKAAIQVFLSGIQYHSSLRSSVNVTGPHAVFHGHYGHVVMSSLRVSDYWKFKKLVQSSRKKLPLSALLAPDQMEKHVQTTPIYDVFLSRLPLKGILYLHAIYKAKRVNGKWKLN